MTCRLFWLRTYNSYGNLFLFNSESIQKELDQRLFQASVTGQNEFQRQYLLRLSVIEGYQYMVKCYRRKVWSRVLELSNLILQTSPGEGVTVLPEESPTRRLVIDRMAQPETENFCQMYRSQWIIAGTQALQAINCDMELFDTCLKMHKAVLM